jgi:hypothetical protein
MRPILSSRVVSGSGRLAMISVDQPGQILLVRVEKGGSRPPRTLETAVGGVIDKLTRRRLPNSRATVVNMANRAEQCRRRAEEGPAGFTRSSTTASAAWRAGNAERVRLFTRNGYDTRPASRRSRKARTETASGKFGGGDEGVAPLIDRNPRLRFTIPARPARLV